MENKDKKPIERWQIILQWVCAASWGVLVIVDLVFGQKLYLTILHCTAAPCFLISAISLTKRYREQQEEQP